MGLFREQRILLTFLKWCAFYPYAPPAPTSLVRIKFAHRVYFLRVGTVVFLLLTMTHVRVWAIIYGGGYRLTNISYIVWLLAVTIDTVMIIVVLLANTLNATHFAKLADLMERLEGTIASWKPPNAYPPYAFLTTLLLLSCVAFHSGMVYSNFDGKSPTSLQLRFEVMVADLNLIHLGLLLHAIGRCARKLRRMLHHAITTNDVAEACRLLRMRDDLLRCVALVNRVYGAVFLGSSVTWVMSITVILYFDFVLNGVGVLEFEYLFVHLLMLFWKSIVTGGLLMLAGFVTDAINAISQAVYRSGTHPSNNRSMVKIIDEALLKCRMQKIRFTCYGLFTIDNSLSYTVICSTVTYLVILIQFRQLEEQMESSSE